ncbi:MAG: hypothetical protein LC795_22225 [Acidobacteria bacterium]|nr:hypothetical protein [Acidobacteriota bacterium]
MNAKLRRYYERGQRCDKFADSHAEDFPANSKGAAQAAAVKERLASLSALDVERANSTGKRQQGSAGRQAAREALRVLVEAVAGTAGAIALDHADVKGVFLLPRTDHTDRTLIATARSFADRAAPFAGLFVEYALPATFINDLRSKADALETYISLQNEGVGGRVNANASAEENLRGLNEALERLNVIFRNQYRDTPSVLAEWESAYHLEAAPGSRRRKKGDPPNNGEPPADGEPPPPPPANA